MQILVEKPERTRNRFLANKKQPLECNTNKQIKPEDETKINTETSFLF